jgi:Zn-dependent protease with chaperone function
VAASYTLAATLAYALVALYATGDGHVPWQFGATVTAVVVTCIVVASLHRLWQLREPGPAIAELLGARYVESGRCTPPERRLLNVVEEMAIASGVRVPPVYIMDGERGVNALVAGYQRDEAVIIATEGLVRELSREELQGVMGHEFSHILNGDMALNVRLAGVLAGLSWLGDLGEALVLDVAERMRQVAPEERGLAAVSAVFGAALAMIGFPGRVAAEAIKAAISRERELLADAASVQFTRDADAIAGALDTLLARHVPTSILAASAGFVSHMFFAEAVSRWWSFATHPPLEERIRRVNPRFRRADYRARRHSEEPHEYAVFDDVGNIVKIAR